VDLPRLGLRVPPSTIDAGYRGAFEDWAKRVLGITVEIIHRRDGGLGRRHRGVLRGTGVPRPLGRRDRVRVGGWHIAQLGEGRRPTPHRVPLRGGAASVGGGAYVWLFGRWRWLSKDYEYLTVTSENTIYLAMSLILAHRAAKATI
jgi:putative transposase